MQLNLGTAVMLRLPRRDRHEVMAKMAEAAREMSGLSQRLLRLSMESARRSTDQRIRILDVVAMQDKIRASAESSRADSRITASRAESVARNTDAGSETITETTHHMQDMVHSISRSAAMMSEFADRVAEVTRIVATIEEIARQTNLLAINAAIEAANAGKEGDGFSVIAFEIRRLADRTRESTVEIGDRMGRMCATAKEAQAAMEKGKLEAEQSVRRSEELQASFQGIRDSMHHVENMSASVAVASERQIASLNVVARDVGKIDELAADCSEEADASAEMSTTMAARASSLCATLADFSVLSTKFAKRETESARQILEAMATHQPAVDRALQMLKSKCSTAGPPMLRTLGPEAQPQLFFGNIDAATTVPSLDAINGATGCLATLFVRQGERLIRVATNVKGNDGQRAIGTALNSRGMAAYRLLVKKSHHGLAYILGKPFLSAYEPILSGEGELIGALYVGHPLA